MWNFIGSVIVLGNMARDMTEIGMGRPPSGYYSHHLLVYLIAFAFMNDPTINGRPSVYARALLWIWFLVAGYLISLVCHTAIAVPGAVVVILAAVVTCNIFWAADDTVRATVRRLRRVDVRGEQHDAVE